MVIRYRSNLTCGIASVLFSALLFFLIPRQVGLERVIRYGVTSRTVPYGLAIVMGVCGLLLIGKSLILKKDEVKQIVLSQEVPVFLMFLVFIAYFFTFEKEWPLATAALGCAALGLSKEKKWWYYLIVVALTVGLFFLFVLVLHIRLHSAIFGF